MFHLHLQIINMFSYLCATLHSRLCGFGDRGEGKKPSTIIIDSLDGYNDECVIIIYYYAYGGNRNQRRRGIEQRFAAADDTRVYQQVIENVVRCYLYPIR